MTLQFLMQTNNLIFDSCVNRMLYLLLADLVDIFLSSTGRVIAFWSEGTGFDPSSERCNDGSGGGLNLKCFRVFFCFFFRLNDGGFLRVLRFHPLSSGE